MTEREKLALLEDLLELEEKKLTPEMELNDIEEYDSVAMLSLIALFEDEFGLKISPLTVREFQTVNDILVKMGN